jgi:hypothetical protein
LEQLLHQDIQIDFDKKSSKFTIAVAGLVFQQNVCEFLLTSSFLVAQDVEEFLLNIDSRYDSVKIPMTTAGKTLTLDLVDFISLRELYSRQLYLLKLEDLLLHRGIRMTN